MQSGQKKSNTLRLQMRFNYHHYNHDDRRRHDQRGAAAAAPMRHKPSI